MNILCSVFIFKNKTISFYFSFFLGFQVFESTLDIFLGSSLGTMSIVPYGQNIHVIQRSRDKCNQVYAEHGKRIFTVEVKYLCGGLVEYILPKRTSCFCMQRPVTKRGKKHKKPYHIFIGWWEWGGGTHYFSHHLPGTPCPHLIPTSFNTQNQTQIWNSKFYFPSQCQMSHFFQMKYSSYWKILKIFSF